MTENEFVIIENNNENQIVLQKIKYEIIFDIFQFTKLGKLEIETLRYTSVTFILLDI